MIYANYIKAGLIIFAICLVFFAGWHMRDRDFTVYKMAVQAAAEKQAAETASVQKQQALVNKGIEDEYNAKLALIRQYYVNGVRNNNGSSTVSGISAAPSISDVISSYNILAGQCAETTAQTIALQDWINQQIGIK